MTRLGGVGLEPMDLYKDKTSVFVGTMGVRGGSKQQSGRGS